MIYSNALKIFNEFLVHFGGRMYLCHPKIETRSYFVENVAGIIKRKQEQ